MDRNSNSPGLICYGPCYRLPYPPCCVCAELESFSIIKFLNCSDKTKVPLLNKIQKKHAPSNILFGYSDDKPQVCIDYLLFCFTFSIFHPFCKLNFLLGSKKGDFTYLSKVHPDRISEKNILKFSNLTFRRFNQR